VGGDLIHDLFTPHVSDGFHPPFLNKADGSVLDKPGKLSYNSASSIRTIVLLEACSMILERIMNGRLSCVARGMGLPNPHQCRSLAGLSVAAACNSLTRDIKTLKMDKRKVSTLFLVIRFGFDNVNLSALCGMLSAKWVNP